MPQFELDWRHTLAAALVSFVILPGVGVSAVITTDHYCTIADAIISANTDTAGPFCAAGSGADRIVLTQDARTYGPSTPAVYYALSVTSEITIDGQGYTIKRHDLQDPTDYRLFQIQSGGDLTIEDATLSVAGDTGAAGAGIAENRGELRLQDCRVVNTISGSTGAVRNRHVMWVDNCFFQLNESTTEYGGAITSGVNCEVGLCTAYISNSEFESNTAKWKGGAIYNGNEGYLSVRDTRFFLNEAVNGGGAIYTGEVYASVSTSLLQMNQVTGASQNSSGGAIYNYGGQLEVKNTTFSENQAGGPGGIYTYEGAAPERDGTTEIEQSTFYGTTATSMFSASSTLGGSANATTIVTGSIFDAGVGGPDCDSTVTNSGFNFGCGSTAVTGLQAWMSWWGGRWFEHALLTGSNAIDSGGSCGLAYDQRGIARDDPCEAGAYEFGLCADRADNAADYDETEVVEACEHLWTKGIVAAPNGNPTLRAGKAVILGNGFTAELGTQMTIEIDPSLLP